MKRRIRKEEQENKLDSTTGLGYFLPQLQSCLHADCSLKKPPMGSSKKAMDLIKSRHHCKLMKKLFDDKKQGLDNSNDASIEDNTSFDSGVSSEQSSRAEIPQSCKLCKNGSDLNVNPNISHDKNTEVNVKLNIPHDSVNFPDLSSFLPKMGGHTVMIAGKPMTVIVADKKEDKPKPKPKIFVSDTESEKEMVSTDGKEIVSKSEQDPLDGQMDTDCSTLAEAKLIELAKLSSASGISMSDMSAYSQQIESNNVFPYEESVGELKDKEEKEKKDEENKADECDGDSKEETAVTLKMKMKKITRLMTMRVLVKRMLKLLLKVWMILKCQVKKVDLRMVRKVQGDKVTLTRMKNRLSMRMVTKIMVMLRRQNSLVMKRRKNSLVMRMVMKDAGEQSNGDDEKAEQW